MAIRRVNKTSRAESDFTQAVRWLLERNPAAAQRFIEDFDNTVRSIAAYPEWFPVQQRSALPELAGLRMAVLRRHGYLIFFTYDTDLVTIRRVVHGAREQL